MSGPDISMSSLYVAEWRKIRGRGLAYAVLLFGLINGLVGPALLKLMLYAGHQLGQDVDPVDWLIGGDVALFFAAFPVNGFALLLLAAILWAEDFSLGTISMIFVRPVARWRVFLAKVVVAWSVGVASLAIAVAAGLLIGLAFFGLSGDTGALLRSPVIGWVAVIPDGAVAAGGLVGEGIGFGARLWGMALRFAACALILGPSLAVAAFVANLTRSPVMTLFGSIFILMMDFGLWAASAAWGAGSYSGSELAATISGWTVWGARHELFPFLIGQEPVGGGWFPVVVTIGYTALFLGLALWMFAKRDVS